MIILNDPGVGKISDPFNSFIPFSLIFFSKKVLILQWSIFRWCFLTEMQTYHSMTTVQFSIMPLAHNSVMRKQNWHFLTRPFLISQCSYVLRTTKLQYLHGNHKMDNDGFNSMYSVGFPNSFHCFFHQFLLVLLLTS